MILISKPEFLVTFNVNTKDYNMNYIQVLTHKIKYLLAEDPAHSAKLGMLHSAYVK